MAKTLCDFTFDGHTYCVVAEVDRFCTVRDVFALAGNKGPRTEDVREQATLIAALLKSGMAFSYFETLTRLGPLAKAMVGAIARERDKAQRAAAKPMGHGARALLAGDPL